jgi:uncharacterized membrane protein YozB (DUF420 family)
MATTLLILHGLVAVALIGAMTHQTLATCATPNARPHSFFGRFRAVPSERFANAVIVLYLTSALLGAIVYLYFKTDIQPFLERDRHWHAMGFLDLKEDFVAIGLGLLPAYWLCWRRPEKNQRHPMRTALTVLLAFVVWWSFLVGHVINNIRGFGS